MTVEGEGEEEAVAGGTKNEPTPPTRLYDGCAAMGPPCAGTHRSTYPNCTGSAMRAVDESRGVIDRGYDEEKGSKA